VVIGAPAPVSPGINVTVANVKPRFVFANAERSGPVGTITYVLEISTTDSFATKVTFTVGEQANQTSVDVPQDLAPSTIYFWHVRAADPSTSGPWSLIFAFQTPAAAPVAPVAPGPVVTPIPGAGVDGIDLTQAQVYNSPYDIAYWAPTSRITRLDLTTTGA